MIFMAHPRRETEVTPTLRSRKVGPLPQRWLTLLAVGAMIGGCSTLYEPPAQPEPRATVEVAAPFERTWEAVIDLFASRSLPIRTIEKVSGLIVAEPLLTDLADRQRWAHCGRVRDGFGRTHEYYPTRADLNVLVREAGASRSTVRVTVRWLYDGPIVVNLPSQLECVTRNVFEREWEGAIKADAERRSP